MVKNKLLAFSVIAVAAVICLFLFRYLFPNEEKQIIRRLNDLAAAVSFEGSVGRGQIATAFWVERLTDYFTETLEIKLEDLDGSSWSFEGRAELRQVLLGLPRQLESLTVKFRDPEVLTVKRSLTAKARLTVEARWQESGADSSLWAHEVSLELVKQEREWRISQVESVTAIRR